MITISLPILVKIKDLNQCDATRLHKLTVESYAMAFHIGKFSRLKRGETT